MLGGREGSTDGFWWGDGDEWGLHESRWWPVEMSRPVAALMKVDFPTPVLPITRTIEGDGLPFCDILENEL